MPQVSATGLSAMPAIDRQQAVMPLTPMGKGGNYKSGIRNRELRTENRELHSPGGGTGRRARLRAWWPLLAVQVRFLSWAQKSCEFSRLF
jgi:hypothetical protein